MIDRYSKIVLTIIAAALVASVAQQYVAPARAVSGSCGSSEAPCMVIVSTWDNFRGRAKPCSDAPQFPCLGVMIAR